MIKKIVQELNEIYLDLLDFLKFKISLVLIAGGVLILWLRDDSALREILNSIGMLFILVGGIGLLLNLIAFIILMVDPGKFQVDIDKTIEESKNEDAK